MRDIIWTLIIIWLVYKLIDLFKAVTVKRSYVNNQQPNSHSRTTRTDNPAAAPKKDIQNAIRKHLNNEGEYVDFEEVK